MSTQAVIGLALALVGQLAFTACTDAELAALLSGDGGGVAIAAKGDPQPSHFSPDGGQQYGVDGTLSARQFAILQGLAWPQAYDDMRSTFGFPTYRTTTADYYALANDTTVWVVVFYQGATATGYTTENR